MRPRFSTGDMVCASLSGLFYGPYGRGIVISVLPSNSIPDAKLRGLADVQPWSYWIMTNEISGQKVVDFVGPISGQDMHPYDFRVPKHCPPQ